MCVFHSNLCNKVSHGSEATIIELLKLKSFVACNDIDFEQRIKVDEEVEFSKARHYCE